MVLTDAWQAPSRSRHPIEDVRAALDDAGCISNNPFLFAQNRRDLLNSLSNFAEDILEASKLLSKYSEVPVFDRNSGKNQEIASIFVKDACNAEKHWHMRFKDQWMIVDKKLRGMLAKQNGEYVCKDAMRALENLCNIVDAAPLVYEMVPESKQQDFVFKV